MWLLMETKIASGGLIRLQTTVLLERSSCGGKSLPYKAGRGGPGMLGLFLSGGSFNWN